jgi:aspartyl-tRNA(Asn)/glutamyl-tRNA(Gln) amidotransferase subunit A
MPLSWSNDHIGPMTRTVQDAALLLGVIAGRDPLDATTSRRAVPDYAAGLDAGIAGLRIGVPENYFFDGVDAEIATGVRDALQVFERLGARTDELRLPDPQTMSDVCNVVSRSESSAIHVRLARERPEEVQPVVRARLEIGFRITAYDYLQALRLRARLTREFIREVFGRADLLVAPVIPEPAPVLAEVLAGSPGAVAERQGRFSRLTRPFNGLGLPALSVPCGFSGDGRPLALQIVGRPFDEATVLRAGHAYEQAAGWFRERPPID